VSLEPTRRAALKLLAGVGALFAVPFRKAFASPATPVAAEPVSLRDLVQMAVQGVAPEIDAALDGTYAKVFKARKATQSVETVVQVSFNLAGNVKVVEPYDDISQRFFWNFHPQQDGVLFHVVPDNDSRTEIRTDLGVHSAIKLRDVPSALRETLSQHRRNRETDAAAVFNTAGTYHAEVGGDGVSICSDRHPRANNGTWSNTLTTPCHLNATALREVLRRIQGETVDDVGLRIRAKGRRLLVPSSMEQLAEQSIADLGDDYPDLDRRPIVWNQLENPYHWFVLTDIDGLTWFERAAFEFDVFVDHVTGTVLVKSHERRTFGCYDPRSVFGSLPSA
jgi:hypothetical protein